jgi:hypothetical protein
MGIVYLARLEDSPPVALKVLRPGAEADFRRRFAREAEAARSVARFCTAPLLDAGIDGQTAYLVTEYVDGPDLATAIRDGGQYICSRNPSDPCFPLTHPAVHRLPRRPTAANEVLLNGEQWIGGQAPLPDGRVAVRIFALLVPVDHA